MYWPATQQIYLQRGIAIDAPLKAILELTQFSNFSEPNNNTRGYNLYHYPKKPYPMSNSDKI